MLTEERRQAILALLEQCRSITTADLEQQFSVSGETLRRDLLALESEKKLIRVHGGAMRVDGGVAEKSFAIRHQENIPQKRELAAQAMAFIGEGDVIAVDSGSTGLILCEGLVEQFKNLTVVTNSLMLFQYLSAHSAFRLILCSGEYDRENEAFFGKLTVESIRSLHIGKSFVCPTALSLKHGLTEFAEEVIPVQCAFLAAAEKCFVLADSSKFEQAGLYSSISLQEELTVITDQALGDADYEAYLAAGIDIIRGRQS